MAQSPGEGALQPIPFTGTGREYFRIWIVNLALTILTLGIYSAWAKVRRLQYFYRNTSIAGNSFDFHGDPKAILMGRLIGVGLLVLYNLAGNFSVLLGLLALAALLAVLPWLLQRSLCFKLHYTSYRGLRFRFAGTVGRAYEAFLLWPVAAYATLGLLAPLAHQKIKEYQHNNSRLGDTSFSFSARTGAFYSIYLKLLGFFLLALVLVAALGAMMAVLGNPGAPTGDRQDKVRIMMLVFVGVLAFYLLLFLAIGPWFSARMQNLVWNNTALGPHVFRSAVRARDLFVIYLTNFLGIVLTLGLFKPFADIRLVRYRLSRMALVAHTDLDEFLAARQQDVSATGEETADVFDVDISF